jgi:hypothetical protein
MRKAQWLLVILGMEVERKEEATAYRVPKRRWTFTAPWNIISQNILRLIRFILDL